MRYIKQLVKLVLKSLGLYNSVAAFLSQKNRRLQAELKSKTSQMLTFENNLQNSFGDQKGQVDFLLNNVFNYELNGLKRGGFFVDLAAADGVTGSNTYFLEKHLGWNGLLFEANPLYQEKLKQARSSDIIAKCVTDQDDGMVTFRIDQEQLGSIVNECISKFKSSQITQVPQTTLLKELLRVNAPSVIDFLSLDVEGSEWLILKDFDFSVYTFRCITIERPTTMLDILLDEKNYIQVAHLSNDVFYVHRDFLQEINLHPSLRFACTPSVEGSEL